MRILLVLFALAVLVAPHPAVTQTPPATQTPSVTPPADDPPVLLIADDLTYDESLDLATATGHVEVSQGERILTADTLTYNRRNDVLTASGNVVLLEPSGDVVFAEYVELTGSMKEGFVRQFRMLLTDDSRLAATTGRRLGGNRTRLRKVVYSPCRTCAGGEDTPLWRIRASQVLHDQAARQVTYRHARLEFAGIPVAWTPYFSHPDPTVRRRSGFLTPSLGFSSVFGPTLSTPYFWAIDDSRDLLLDPVFYLRRGVLAQGEYRQALDNGRLRARVGGIVETVRGSKRFQGYTDIEGRLDLSDRWRAGLDLDLAMNKGFLRRHNISTAASLTSRVFAERFEGRTYAQAEALYFQTQRDTDRQRDIPVVAPKLDYDYISGPDRAGGSWHFETENFVLTRPGGTDSRRLSATTAWRRSFADPLGGVSRFEASLQTDLYHAEKVQRAAGQLDNGWTGRIFPQLSLEWRLPLIRHGEKTVQIIEPVLQAVAAPNGGNSDRIPNEDSLLLEFDETNLFSRNRFTGRDRVDGGQRLVYGLRGTVLLPDGGDISAFAGQSYRLKKDSSIPATSGFADHFSDYVARFRVSPTPYGSLHYRTRIDKDTLAFRRNEASLKLGRPALNLSTDYLSFVSNDPGIGKNEEIGLTVNSQLSSEWSVSASILRDLERREIRSWSAALDYHCDCLKARFEYKRNFFQGRDIKPEDIFFVRIDLKNLGGAAQIF